MVAHFLRLKLRLLGNILKRSVWQTIGLCIAVLYAFTVVSLLIVGAIAAGGVNPALMGHAVTVVGAFTVLGWWIIPVFVFGVDPTLDPQRFTTFAIPHRTLITGLAVSGVLSVPGAITALAATGASFAWWQKPWIIPVALLGSALGVAACVVGSRAVTTALAPLLESRRYREVLALVAVVPIMLVGPVIGWVSDEFGAVSNDASGGSVTVTADASSLWAVIERFGELAAWTPFGAAWSLPSSVYDGDWGVAVARFAIAVGTVALLWLIWDRSLARALVTPSHSGSGGKSAHSQGLGWFHRFPATPVGAVAARATTYWLRDPRYSAGVGIILLLPLILWLPARSAENFDILLLAGPILAWILAFSVSNDVGYDYTAFALHVATGVSGHADRWGRAVPVLLFGTPVVLAVAIASVGLANRWELVPTLVGVSLGVLGLTLGASSVFSARVVYPAPKPGESPFKSPQGAALATMISQLIAMAIVAVLAAPLLGLGVWAVISGSQTLGWFTLLTGVTVGVALLIAGVKIGARIFDRRTPDLLQQVQAY